MSTNQPTEAPSTRPAVAQWPTILVTVLVGLFALFRALPQIFPAAERANDMNSFPNLNKRAEFLQKVSDPIQREQYGIGLAAYGRQIDRALTEAEKQTGPLRVFFSGMIGKDHGSRGGYYFFLRNYLFPREVEISIDRKAVYHEGWFEGVDASSPLEAQTNGFDIWLKIGDDNNITGPLLLRPQPGTSAQ